MKTGRAASVMLAMMIAAPALPAFAQPSPTLAAPRVGLVYTRGVGAGGCPNGESLRRALAAQMGSRFDFHDPDPADDDEKRIEVKVRREGRRFVGTWLVREHGIVTWKHDDLADPDCREIIATAAASIAIVVDSAPVRRRSPPPVEVPAPVAPPEEPERAPAPPPPAPPPAQPAPRPGAFEGPAGIGRMIAFALAGAGLAVGTGFAVAAANKLADAHPLQAALEEGSGTSACSQGGASCAQLDTLVRQHDTYSNAAIGLMLAGGATAAAGVASIWIVRTSSHSVEVTPTAPGALAALTLHGSW